MGSADSRCQHLIGLLDTAANHHTVAVDEIEAADQANTVLVTLAGAYSEALVSVARAGMVPEAREAISAMGIFVAPMTAAIAERAAELRASTTGASRAPLLRPAAEPHQLAHAA